MNKLCVWCHNHLADIGKMNLLNRLWRLLKNVYNRWNMSLSKARNVDSIYSWINNLGKKIHKQPNSDLMLYSDNTCLADFSFSTVAWLCHWFQGLFIVLTVPVYKDSRIINLTKMTKLWSYFSRARPSGRCLKSQILKRLKLDWVT